MDSIHALSTIGDRLKAARARSGLSQAKLAKKAGCGQTTIASIESGRNYGSTLIPRIAKILGVDPLWLSDGIGDTRQTDVCHLSAVVLCNEWVYKVRPIIEPYLLPASARLNDLPMLYATEVVSDGQFFSVRPDVEDGKFIPLIRIPVFAVLMVFEASKESLQVGFVDE